MGADNTFGEEHFNPDMMNSTDALREFAEKYKSKVNYIDRGLDEKLSVENYWNTQQLLFDLTALISEDYVEKKDAGYPLEFVEWLIKDQEIFFGELNEEYILNDNIHVGGRKLQTIDELFNYWKENEQ